MNNHPIIRNWIIVIAVILLVIVMSLTVNGRGRVTFIENALHTVLKPIQGGLSGVSEFIEDKTYPIRNVFSIAEENKALRQALNETQQALIDQTMLQEEYNDLKSLRKALNYAYRNNINDHLTANVIARDAENWYGMFTIDVGLADGVTENALVRNGSGLIGQVFEVSDHSSKVLTIVDIRGAVSFEIVDEVRNFDGILNGVELDELEGYLFDQEAEIFEGDQIVTSGLGIYPKGVIIGTVSEVVGDEDTLLKHIKVQPNVDFKRIDRVFVIPVVRELEE